MVHQASKMWHIIKKKIMNCFFYILFRVSVNYLMFKIVHVVRWKSDVQNVKLVGYIFSPNSTTRRGWWWWRRRRCPWWNEKFQFSKKGEQTSRGRGKSGKRGIETDEWTNERTDNDDRPHDWFLKWFNSILIHIFRRKNENRTLFAKSKRKWSSAFFPSFFFLHNDVHFCEILQWNVFYQKFLFPQWVYVGPLCSY